MNEEKQKQDPQQNKTDHPDHIVPPPQKPLRTYESDVADVLAQKNISTTNIAMAESRRKSGGDRIGSSGTDKSNSVKSSVSYLEDNSSQTTKKILIGLAGLIFIGIGVLGVFYFYNMSPLAVKPVVPVAPAPTSIVPTDSRVYISIDKTNPSNTINSIKQEISKPQTNNTIKEIILTQDNNGQKFNISAQDILPFTGINPPNILTRSLSNDWMLGEYTNNSGIKNIFVVATIGYFQNAFAGMLQWESVMPDDLSQYLPINGVIKGSFVDRIIHNRDVREFVTLDKKVLFLYSFIDNTKLVITGSESTLIEILSRLEQKDFVR